MNSIHMPITMCQLLINQMSSGVPSHSARGQITHEWIFSCFFYVVILSSSSRCKKKLINQNGNDEISRNDYVYLTTVVKWSPEITALFRRRVLLKMVQDITDSELVHRGAHFTNRYCPVILLRGTQRFILNDLNDLFSIYQTCRGKW